MEQLIKKISFTLLISLILNGCMMRVGNHNTASYTKINNVSYHSRVENVLAYYEGAPPEQPYIQLGLVEVQGSRSATSSDLLKKLKYKALENGADAVINIKKFYKTRESGLLLDTIIDDKHERPTYESIVLQGLAIRFKNIDDLPEDEKAYLQTKDESMHSYIQNEAEENTSDAETDLFATIILWVIMIVAALS